MSAELLHREVTDAILEAFFHVYNTLGYGFLEKVYERSLALRLSTRGHCVQQQFPIVVFFEGEEVGEYFADLLVDQSVIVEVKTASDLGAAHDAQLVNYLRATRFEVGLLLNFGEEPTFRRRVLHNERKPFLKNVH